MSIVSDFAAFRQKKNRVIPTPAPQVEVFKQELSQEQLEALIEEAAKKVQDKLPKRETQPATINAGFSIDYHRVDKAEYTVSSWIKGYNILGVTYDGPVTIYLPKKLKKAIVAIKDERGDAAANNITVTVQE